MLVYQNTKSCPACGNGRDINVVVDLHLDEIKLSPSPVACSCGYFKVRVHDPVTFNKYRSKKELLLGCISGVQKDLSIEDQVEKELGCVTDRIAARRSYLNERLTQYQQELTDLGPTPVPDFLGEE